MMPIHPDDNDLAMTIDMLEDDWPEVDCWLKELQHRRAVAANVDDLVMHIRRLVHSLKKHNPDSELAKQVMDYLTRNGYFNATDCLRANGDKGANHG